VKTGQETDVWNWFGASASDGDDKAELPDRLRQALFKGVTIDAECKGTDYDGRGRFHPSLKEDGVVLGRCERQRLRKRLLLPYSKVGPS
jgi:hypothetical protein